MVWHDFMQTTDDEHRLTLWVGQFIQLANFEGWK
jgi:hypothetical protein